MPDEAGEDVQEAVDYLAETFPADGDIEGAIGSGWWLQAQFPDGTTSVVQAPDSFTQEQVRQLAEAVVHTP